MAMTILDEYFKILNHVITLDGIKQLIYYAFNTSEVTKKDAPILNAIADKFRKLNDSPLVRYSLVKAIAIATDSAKEVFFSDPANSDIKEIYDSDPTGEKAAAQIKDKAIDYGAEIAGKKIEKLKANIKVLEEERSELYKHVAIWNKDSYSRESYNRKKEFVQKYKETDEEYLKILEEEKILNAKVGKTNDERNALWELWSRKSERETELFNKANDERYLELGYTPEKRKEIEDRLKEISKLKHQGIKATKEQIVDEMMELSGISEETARKWADENCELDGVSRRYGEKGLAQIKEELIKIYRVSGGNLGRVVLDYEKNTRSNACGDSINLSLCDSKYVDHAIHTIWHEAGHLIENSLNLMGLASYAWIKSRATGGPEGLGKATGDNSYRKHEVAFPGPFSSPYVGKFYPGRNETEVISMGLQALNTSEHEQSLLQDPQHISYLSGILFNFRGYKSQFSSEVHTLTEDRDGSIKGTGGYQWLNRSEARSKRFFDSIRSSLSDSFISAVTRKGGGINGWSIKIPKGVTNWYGLYYNGRFYSGGAFSLDEALCYCYLLVCVEQGIYPSECCPTGKIFWEGVLDYWRSRYSPIWWYPGMKLPTPKVR